MNSLDEFTADCATLAVDMYAEHGRILPTLWLQGGKENAIVVVTAKADGNHTNGIDPLFAACRHIVQADDSEAACLAVAMDGGESGSYIGIFSETKSGMRDVSVLNMDGSVAAGNFAQWLGEALYESPEFRLFQDQDEP